MASDPMSGANLEASEQSIIQAFKAYGYTPSPQEIQALLPAAIGEGGSIAGPSAVANFVIAMQQLQGAQSLVQGNVKAEQGGATQAQALGDQYAGQGAQSYQQALQALQQAPRLFGSMTPDQINQYLQPLQNQFNYGLGQVQGTSAQRGMAGSSLEANALAQSQTQFQQNVLSQGLSIGQQQQQQQAAALQGLGGQQFGLSGTNYGLAPQYLGLANQSAGQNTGISEDIAQLPGQATALGMLQNQTMQAMNPQGSSPLGSALGLGLGFAFGGPIGAQLGGNIASAATGNPLGANVGQAVNPLGGMLGMTQQPQAQGAGNQFYPGLLSMMQRGQGGAGAGAGASLPASAYTSGLNAGQSLMAAA